MTSERFPKISPYEQWILKFFLDYPSGLTLNTLIEERYPQIVLGYVPGGFRDQRGLANLKEAFRGLISKKFLSPVFMDRSRYKLSSLGEDYILEVLWKYE